MSLVPQHINKSGYSNQEIDKIGNTLIYLTNNITGLTKTQALKYLYLLDEFSIKKFGIPFIGLKYEVWQYGPVAQDIFLELTEEQPKMLKDYIYIELERFQHYQYLYLKTKKSFIDDEFTDSDIEILEFVTTKYKNLNATELSDLTHAKNSLWHNIALEQNLLEAFRTNRKRASNFIIDFSIILDEEKKEIYNSYNDNIEINRHYSNV
ncbi:Uncharacterized phage-associated protein [Maribacter aquivivus]|uniref:Uncharacterized phage-associated protein n=1 Tax=Maribacter aquivivus TaxID=228958 RepID=A0A1M6UT96_9FLAO|nr:Panacea domain-containing protein [Maribacter aquivivus]SHK72394.1 Uncharacterized phage-associated protein [Maribacter aquivivus]